MSSELEDEYLNTLGWINPGNLQDAIREAKDLIRSGRHDRVVIYSDDEEFRLKIMITRKDV